MPISHDTLTAVRQALEQAGEVDASRVSVETDGDEVVLRGAVSTASQADAAATLALPHAPAVRNALSVDPGLREDTSSEGAATAPATGGAGPVEPGRRSSHNEKQSVQVSEFRPVPVDDDLVAEQDAALGENLAWDPPDAPHSAPTESEQRGTTPRETDTEPPTAADPDHTDPDPDEEPSLPGVSAAELARDATRDDDRDRR